MKCFLNKTQKEIILKCLPVSSCGDQGALGQGEAGRSHPETSKYKDGMKIR